MPVEAPKIVRVFCLYGFGFKGKSFVFIKLVFILNARYS